MQLLAKGRTVIAAARDAEKAKTVFKELGLKEGAQKGAGGAKGGILIFQGIVDVTSPATLTAELFEGVTQVISAVGPVFGRTADGKMG